MKKSFWKTVCMFLIVFTALVLSGCGLTGPTSTDVTVINETGNSYKIWLSYNGGDMQSRSLDAPVITGGATGQFHIDGTLSAFAAKDASLWVDLCETSTFGTLKAQNPSKSDWEIFVANAYSNGVCTKASGWSAERFTVRIKASNNIVFE